MQGSPRLSGPEAPLNLWAAGGRAVSWLEQWMLGKRSREEEGVGQQLWLDVEKLHVPEDRVSELGRRLGTPKALPAQRATQETALHSPSSLGVLEVAQNHMESCKKCRPQAFCRSALLMAPRWLCCMVRAGQLTQPTLS